MRVRIACDELRRLRELTLAINRLEREIAELVEQIAPQLLGEPGFSRRSLPSSSARSPARSASRHRRSWLARRAWRRSRQAREHAAPPARPGRQPPDQRRTAPRDRHPRAVSRAHTRLHRTATPRRQEHPRSDPLPQALPRPPRLAPAPSRHPQDIPTHRSLHIEATEAGARRGAAIASDEQRWSSRRTPARRRGRTGCPRSPGKRPSDRRGG
jgi:hypothetical protein